MNMVGILARNEASTIAGVAEAADKGLHLAFPSCRNVVMLADSGSVDGTVQCFATTRLQAEKVMVCSNGADSGKGTNVLAISGRALQLGARQVVILGGNLRTPDPEWVRLLASAVAGGKPAIALATHARDRYDASIANHLVRPLIAATFGAHLAQPIGGEVAMNYAFLQEMSSWEAPDSARLYGIDAWLTANALRQSLKVTEVPLGGTVHRLAPVKTLPRCQQVVDALFYVMTWLDKPHPAPRTAAAYREVVSQTAARRSPPQLPPALCDRLTGYVTRHREDLCALFPSIRSLQHAPWGVRIPVEAWPDLLADAVEGLAAGEFLRSRDHLAVLLACRTATFWYEIESLDAQRIDSLLAHQARDTAKTVRRRKITFGELFQSSWSTGLWKGL
ncbi:hypothetical protein O1L44_00395 [Streptomyces noursei]|uniref:family 2 glycosyl transferase n=1 Tax=Streptomyces noursei TaxID=1971 RepID=UPI0013520FA0|nr:hypothetical protein [Streptomyces noursei]